MKELGSPFLAACAACALSGGCEQRSKVDNSVAAAQTLTQRDIRAVCEAKGAQAETNERAMTLQLAGGIPHVMRSLDAVSHDVRTSVERECFENLTGGKEHSYRPY